MKKGPRREEKFHVKKIWVCQTFHSPSKYKAVMPSQQPACLPKLALNTTGLTELGVDHGVDLPGPQISAALNALGTGKVGTLAFIQYTNTPVFSIPT